MSLKLRNSWKYIGDDWWEWTAFVDDGGSGEIRKVKYVQYVLHESFSEATRRIDTPNGGFRLELGGWGTFELVAFAHLNDGKKIRLKHSLRLEYEPPEGTSK